MTREEALMWLRDITYEAEQVTGKLQNPCDSLLTEDSEDSKEQKSKLDHDREWIIGCIKHDGFIKTDRFDKANQIILDALSLPIDITAEQWDMYVDELRKIRESFITPQTDTDLISRADAIEAFDRGRVYHKSGIEEIVRALPSAEPKGDLISRRWLLDLYGDYIGDNGDPKYHVPLEVVRQNIIDVPSAERSGQWIAQKHKGEYVEFDVYVCSECGIVGGIQANEWNYCPNCGADMRGESDEQYTG